MIIPPKQNKRCLGPGKAAFFIPQFIFNASACKHDEYYERGGDAVDKIYADTMFYAYMLEDIKKGDYGFFRKYFYFNMATLYYIIVSIFGWGPWIYQIIRKKLQ